ncbi:hypothetical protein FHS74_000604 [Nitrospirillum iridis]|uniref:Uncharacterized protein n=1 Tax=Nitrospirillum iridis TaxID=765888 RepID=A0A7X0AWR8_9PROT|nr:hypothetical protein [Nitrospirillum iridis]
MARQTLPQNGPLAGVPLVVKGAGGFQVRPATEVGRLLRRAPL